MPQTGYSRSPKVVKGALVQLEETLGVPLPQVIPFQYNPERVTRSFAPFSAAEVNEVSRTINAPAAQPFDPEETLNLVLELDAADQLEDNDGIAKVIGVADRIAALEQLLFPGESLLGALITAVASLLGPQPPARATVPICLLILGPGRIQPVRVVGYSIEEQLFTPTLFPMQARVSLSLRVLTDDELSHGPGGAAVEIARAAYAFNRTQRKVLAAAHLARNADAIRGLLPF